MDDAAGSKRGRRRRGGGGADGSVASGPSINQQPWEIPRRAFRPMELLSEEQVELIHENSLKILEELGIELMSEAACRVYEKAGALVDWDSMCVRVPRDVVRELVERRHHGSRFRPATTRARCRSVGTAWWQPWSRDRHLCTIVFAVVALATWRITKILYA